MSSEQEALVMSSSGSASRNSGLIITGVQSLSSPSPVPGPPPKRKRSSLDVKSLQAASFPQSQAASSIYRIGFLGAGNMARALAEGMIASGQVSRSSITASATSSTSENLKKMKDMGVNITSTNQDVILNSDIIVLAVKPHQILDVMKEIHDTYTAVQQQAGSRTPTTSPRSFRPLIVSVAASVPLADIEEKAEISWLMGGSAISGHLPVVRCLPTVASAVRSGVTVYTRGRFCNDADVKPFITLFSLVGHCEEVAEKLQDSFSGFSGAGIAFMAVVLEGMADGGVMTGIPRAMSQRIAAHTMLSAANLVLQKKLHPGEVKDSVASPGGTTIRGLHCMERGGVRGLMIEAVKAAADRAEELKPKPTKSNN